jgi:hypothetical protein
MTTVDVIDDLAAAVSGEVLRPTDRAHTAHVAGFNLAITHRPEAVVAAPRREAMRPRFADRSRRFSTWG